MNREEQAALVDRTMDLLQERLLEMARKIEEERDEAREVACELLAAWKAEIAKKRLPQIDPSDYEKAFSDWLKEAEFK